MKKIISFIFTACALLGMLSVSVCAAPDWGSYEEGIKQSGHMAYYDTYDGAFPNGDFSEGLKYWGEPSGKVSPNKIATVQKDTTGNAYLQFGAEKAWDGLYSVVFTDPKIKIGDKPSVLFKFQGSSDFQIILMQQSLNLAKNKRADETRLAFRHTTIIKGKTDDDWNVAILEPSKAVIDPLKAGSVVDDPTLYFNFYVQLTNDATATPKFDDLQIVNYDTEAAIIKDLDGNKIYDLNELKASNSIVLDYTEYAPDELIVLDGDYPSDKAPSSSSNGDGDDGPPIVLIGILIAAGVIVIAAAAVITIVLVKKKKTAPAKEDSTASAEDTQEPEETL